MEKSPIFYKILNLPVKILEAILVTIKKIWQILWPVSRIFLGACLLVAMFFSFLAFSIAVVVFIFNINSPFIVSDLPIDYLVHSPLYYLGMSALYLLVVVPIVLLFQLAITMIRNKNSFSNILNIFLVSIWFLAIIFGSAVFGRMAPTVIEKIEAKKNSEIIISEFDFENFDKIYVSANVDLKIKESPDFFVKVTGPTEEISRLNFAIEDEQLQITQKRRTGWCFFCFDYQPEVEVYSPGLDSYVGVGNSQGQILGFADDMFINLGESGRLKADIESKNIILKLSGISPFLDLEADPENLKIELGGFSRLDLDRLDLDFLEIIADNFSRLNLEGTAVETDATLAGQADVDLLGLKTEKVSANLEGNSQLFLGNVSDLKVIAEDNSKLEYINAIEQNFLLKNNAELIVIDQAIR
jgi:hypothetical protein